MKIPKTPIEFDYDLWTTEDGKCMVRVKRTGEVSEVDRKIMRILRAEEKRIRRSYGSDNTSEDEDGAEKISDTVLSLDAMPEDDVKSAAWLADSRDCMEELITALKEKELLSILTEKQRELYLAMTREGLTLREFARRKGIGIRAAFDLKAAVQKKFQKIFRQMRDKYHYKAYVAFRMRENCTECRSDNSGSPIQYPIWPRPVSGRSYPPLPQKAASAWTRSHPRTSR